MPILFELVKVVISIFVVGSLGVLSFFGADLPVQTEVSVSGQDAQDVRDTPLSKVGGEEVGGRPVLPTLREETLPPPTPTEGEHFGGGGVEIGPPAPAFAPPEEAVAAPKPAESPASEELFIADDTNRTTRDALVNILCTSKAGGPLRPVSGSGVIIDERGVIVTNAHIGQFFLLLDYPEKDAVSCIIRTGSPARPAYHASLLYVPPAWIEKNARLITERNPLGTGENDYALLLITTPIDKGASLPSSFAFVEPNVHTDALSVGDTVLLAGYPAGFLSGAAIQRDLSVVSTVADIQELFTFVADTLDLISLGGSVVAQQGSSGGAVVNGENELIGIMVTSSEAESTADRDLRAITLGHINRSLAQETNFDLPHLLFGDLRIKAEVFNLTAAPELTARLIAELDR